MYTLSGKLSKDKKHLPDYRQLTAYIPIKLLTTFQMICKAEMLQQNEAVERAIQSYIDSKIG